LTLDPDAISLRTLILWNGLIIPALFSAALLLGSRPLWRRATIPQAGTWPLALAVGLGFVIGHVRIEGWRPFPPREAADRLGYLALMAVPLSFLDLWRSCPAWLRWVLHASLWMALVWSMLPPSLAKESSWAEVGRWLVGLGVVGLIFWTVLAYSARRLPGALIPFVVLIASLGTVGALHAGHSLKLTQLAGVLAATLLPVLIRSAALPRAEMAIAPVMVLLPGLWLMSYFYSDGEHLVRSFALLALAAISGALGFMPGTKSLAPCLKSLIGAAAAIVLAVMAVVLAHRSSSIELDDVMLR
jgi:hypothetical protein